MSIRGLRQHHAKRWFWPESPTCLQKAVRIAAHGDILSASALTPVTVTAGQQQGQNIPENMFDTNDQTTNGARRALPHWVIVDFGEEKTFNGIFTGLFHRVRAVP